jgi:hypothetical protein
MCLAPTEVFFWVRHCPQFERRERERVGSWDSGMDGGERGRAAAACGEDRLQAAEERRSR